MQPAHPWHPVDAFHQRPPVPVSELARARRAQESHRPSATGGDGPQAVGVDGEAGLRQPATGSRRPGWARCCARSPGGWAPAPSERPRPPAPAHRGRPARWPPPRPATAGPSPRRRARRRTGRTRDAGPAARPRCWPAPRPGATRSRRPATRAAARRRPEPPRPPARGVASGCAGRCAGGSARPRGRPPAPRPPPPARHTAPRARRSGHPRSHAAESPVPQRRRAARRRTMSLTRCDHSRPWAGHAGGSIQMVTRLTLPVRADAAVAEACGQPGGAGRGRRP